MLNLDGVGHEMGIPCGQSMIAQWPLRLPIDACVHILSIGPLSYGRMLNRGWLHCATWAFIFTRLVQQLED